MIPGMGGMDPRSMAKMMNQLGIKNEDVPAKKVTIETEDSILVIENPQVVKITMQGQVSFQISGEVKEQSAGPSEEDIKMVCDSTGTSAQEAKKALEESGGDIAQAILKLKPE